MDSSLHRVLKLGLLSLFLLVPLAVFPWAFYSFQVKSVLLVGCVALTAMGWLWIAIVEDRHEVGLTFTNGVLAFNMLVWIATLALSPHINEGLPVISERLAGVGFLLLTPVLLSRKRDLKLGLALLLATAAVMSLYGLLQFFHLDPFQAEGKVGHFRVVATAHHPNIFVTFLVACVPLNIAAFRLFEGSNRNRILLGLSLVLSLTAAGATLSRAGWGAMVVAVLVTVLGIWAGSRGASAEAGPAAASKRSLLMVAVPVGLAVMIMAGMVFALTRGMMDPGEQERMLGGSTMEKRVLIYRGALKMAAEDPLLGKGLGTFSLFLPAYRTPELARQFPRNEYHAEAAVSEPLEVQVESGVLGLLGWLLLVALFVIRPLRAMSRVDDPGLRALLAAAAAAALGMVAHGLVEVSLRFMPPLFMFWAVPGLALAAERIALGDTAPTPPRTLDLSSWPLRLGLSVVVGMTFGLIFAVTLSDFVANIFVDRGERALKRGEVQVAKRSFRSAEATWTGNLPGRYRLAYVLWKQGDFKGAEREYREVARLSPYYFDVNHNLARVLFAQRNDPKLGAEKLRQAAVWTQKATRLNSHHIPSHWLAVQIELHDKKVSEAEGIARQMLKAAGDYKKAPNTARFVWSRMAMARVREAQGRTADALRLVKQALEADPQNKDARHLRGTLKNKE